MSYRDDLAALSARHDNLEQELAQKTRERDQAAALLAEARHKASLPVLDNLRVASPCTADWNQMKGDDRARHCGECNRNVYNITSMTRDEAHALLMSREGRLCVRYFQRHDGTILLADCEIGARRRRGRRMLAATAAMAVATTPVALWQVLKSDGSDCVKPTQPANQTRQRQPRPQTPHGSPVAPNDVSPAPTPTPTPARVDGSGGQWVGGGSAAGPMPDELSAIQAKPARRAHVVITK